MRSMARPTTTTSRSAARAATATVRKRARFAGALGREQCSGERCGIDRDLQPRPQVEKRTEMILVGVGKHQADDIFALLHQIADVGQDQIDTGQLLFGGKRHAKIDREPTARPPIAQPVDRQVHADFADTAERRKHQFLLPLRHNQAPPNPNTSPAVTVARPSGCCTNIRPASSSPSKRPRSSRSGNRTLISSPRPAARANQSARIEAKSAPLCHCASRRSIAADSAVNKASGATTAPASSKSVAGKNVSSGWLTQLTPKPMTTLKTPSL